MVSGQQGFILGNIAYGTLVGGVYMYVKESHSLGLRELKQPLTVRFLIDR
jgi:hypothetical protein